MTEQWDGFLVDWTQAEVQCETGSRQRFTNAFLKQKEIDSSTALLRSRYCLVRMVARLASGITDLIRGQLRVLDEITNQLINQDSSSNSSKLAIRSVIDGSNKEPDRDDEFVA